MTLIEKLTAETATFKADHIAQVTEWAVRDFAAKREWLANYHKGKYGFAEASKTAHRMPRYIHASWGTAQDHVEVCVKDAEAHYAQSIEKLADRIIKKGMNIENIKIQTAYLGVNLDMKFTDGTKTVRAFTIIAEGYIQRPHYRYLIK